MQHTILYFPDYVHANPYQSLSYSGIDAVFCGRSGDLEEACRELRRQGRGGRVIFHLHWEDAIYRHLPDEGAARDACRRFLDRLERFRGDGGLFLWTVHNRAPHDGRYLDIHRELCAKLGSLADQIHLHSHAALEELERDRELDRDKVTIIPHGNYRPLYPDACPPEPAAPDDGPCFLLFGRLGRYKGGAELARSFAALDDPRARLILAGKQIDPIDLSGLPATVRARITVHDRYLCDADLLEVFGAAHFVVSPYLASLTSGTVLLALSLARPVIVPRLPTLTEVVIDGDNGLLFAPDEPGALRDALERAGRIDAEAWRRMAGRALATAERYDPQMIGHLLSGLLYRLLAMRPPGPSGPES